MHNIKTFLFLDTETTGLPFEENNRTRITELCLIAVQRDHLTMGVFPRVQNKINLCFNPGKYINPTASKITGLSNELLEFQPNFTSSSYNLMLEFLNMCKKPICLIAHNGNRFDYPILKAEFYKTGNELPEDILCADSWLAFKQLLTEIDKPLYEVKQEIVEEDSIPVEFQDGLDDALLNAVKEIENKFGTSSKKVTVENIQRINETTPTKTEFICIQLLGKRKFAANNSKDGSKVKKKLFSNKASFSLGNLYSNITGKEAVDAHRAECDVNMIIECASILGQSFVDWCDSNATKFCDIPMMVPGKPLGK